MSAESATVPIPANKGPAPAEIACPYCQLQIPRRAKKCGHCGEWLANTSSTPAVVLAAAGWVWLILSVLGALGLLFATDFEPLSFVYAVAAALQGVLVGMAAVVLGESHRKA